jgi:hypothetical protein
MSLDLDLQRRYSYSGFERKARLERVLHGGIEVGWQYLFYPVVTL